MSDGIEFDFSVVNALTADLGQVAPKAMRNVRRAVEVTARNVKDDWIDAADRTGLHGYAHSVDYDVTVGPDGVSAEVGPNLGRNQGSFGFVEDAPGDVQSAPQHAGRDAAKANEQDFIRGLLLAISDPIENP